MSAPIHNQFQAIFGRPAEFVVRAPGRINLIGEHVDYLDGLVMPMAIDRFLTMSIAESAKSEIRIWSEWVGGEPMVIQLNDLNKRLGDDSWVNYIVGVLAKFSERGTKLRGFDAVITADLPSGAGLSSSAALETATALTIEALNKEPLEPIERAYLCREAEHDFAGVPCGIMDQLAIGLGQADHALMIDCRSMALTPTRIPKGIEVVVADTKMKHSLSDGAYKKRREECESARELLGVDSLRDVPLAAVEASRELLGDCLYRRARHAVTEISRVEQFASDLASEEMGRISDLMRASHDSLRDDYEVSCDELDLLVDAAYEFGSERGLIGSRMTGGGFGGSMVSLVSSDSAQQLVDHLRQSFMDGFGKQIDPFITRAVAGAQVEFPSSHCSSSQSELEKAL